MVFAWSYYQFGSRYVYDEKWSILRIVQNENRVSYRYSPDTSKTVSDKCSYPIGTRIGEGNCSPSQLFFYLGYFAALWSRLAEIGIRTTFIVFTSIASLLFEALDEKIEKIAKKSSTGQEYSKQEMAVEIDELRQNYDLVCQLVEQINRSFGFVLLLITGHDFAIAIMDFNNILDQLTVGQKFHKEAGEKNQGEYSELFKSTDLFFDPFFEFKPIVLRANPFETCQFAHPILRFLLLLVASHRVGSKVSQNKLRFFFQFLL